MQFCLKLDLFIFHLACNVDENLNWILIKAKTPLALKAFSFSFAKSINCKVCRQNPPINNNIHERWKNSSHLAKKLGLIGVCKSSFAQYSTFSHQSYFNIHRTTFAPQAPSI